MLVLYSNNCLLLAFSTVPRCPFQRVFLLSLFTISNAARIFQADDYPTLVLDFPVRVSPYSGEMPVSRGLLSRHLGIKVNSLFSVAPDSMNALPARVSSAELRRVLQCSPTEPGLQTHSGALSLLELAPPTQYGAMVTAAFGEVALIHPKIHCELSDCQELVNQFAKGLYPTLGDMRSSFASFGMLRVMNNSVFHDWPWGRERFAQWRRTRRADSSKMLADNPLVAKDGDLLVRAAARLVNDLPDSTFLIGGEEPALDWNWPFPILSHSARLEKLDIPWPFPSMYLSESEHDSRARATSERLSVAWDKRKPKAAFFASYRSLRHVAFDLAVQRPDLIDAHSKLCVGVEEWQPWSLDSREQTEVVNTNTPSAGSSSGHGNQNRNRPGFLRHLEGNLSSCQPQSYNPQEYKFVVVVGYSNGLTGRLSHLLAHSGAVVLMPDSPFRYHFSARLLPWVHYVPLAYSSADLVQKIEWLLAHDDLAERIARNAANFGASYLRSEDYVCYALAALEAIGNVERGSDVLLPFPPSVPAKRTAVPETMISFAWWLEFFAGMVLTFCGSLACVFTCWRTASGWSHSPGSRWREALT